MTIVNDRLSVSGCFELQLFGIKKKGSLKMKFLFFI